MAPITSPSKILVTGASGYIAAWVVKSILDNGHQVIGTVRSPSKGEYLQNQFGDKFSYVIVEDIGKVPDHVIPSIPIWLNPGVQLSISQELSMRLSNLVWMQ
jgi:nucleoside-diphosphate-sugar epimerase